MTARSAVATGQREMEFRGKQKGVPKVNSGTKGPDGRNYLAGVTPAWIPGNKESQIGTHLCDDR